MLFLAQENYNPLSKYKIALASRGAVRYNGSLDLFVFTFESVFFTKNNIFVFTLIRRIYSHNFEGLQIKETKTAVI